MPWLDEKEAEELRRDIERSRKAMENRGGADLDVIVAETAYDYWPQRAALARAKARVGARAAERSELASIDSGERAELVAAIGRTQEALRGDAVDLEEIARTGSREYWAARKKVAEGAIAGDVAIPALAAMPSMLWAADQVLASHGERRRPWRGVLYDVAAVVLPLLFVPPLLLYVIQGSLEFPDVAPLKSFRAFADPRFLLAAVSVLVGGIGTLSVAYRQPENQRRVLQFGGALTASLLMAVVGAAYAYGNRTTSGLDGMQAKLQSGLLLSLIRSYDTGRIIVPAQVDRSMRIETETLTQSAALLSAHDPSVHGKILVRLQPRSAAYSWLVNGKEIPMGKLTVAQFTAFNAVERSITLRSGNETHTYAAGELLPDVSVPVGSRVAAEIGADNAITSLYELPETAERAQIQ